MTYLTLRVRGVVWTIRRHTNGEVWASGTVGSATSYLNVDGLHSHPDHDPLPLPVVLAMAALYTGAA